jgi:hypothetical protein
MIRALAEGRLGEWEGMPPGLTLDEVGLEGGASGVPGILGGAPAVAHLFAATEFAPYGVIVWFEDGVASIVEIQEPQPPAPPEEILGPPDGIVESLLGSTRRQYVWARRGLAMHIQDGTGAVYRLYGFASCSLEEWMADPLSRVAQHRIPLE